MVRTCHYHGPRLGADKDFHGSGSGTDAARWKKLDGERAGKGKRKKVKK